MKKRILVVDDSPDTARSMKLLLKMQGYDSQIALDGPEAIEIARTEMPDAVLLDMRLPSMTGEAVAEAIRQIPGLEKVVIVSVSGLEPDENSLGTAIDAHMTKPIDHDKLFNYLERRLSGSEGPPKSN